jgi:starch synthase
MKILMACAEYAPFAKTGGLADAVSGLCAALAERGHDVRVVLPRYAHLNVSRSAAEHRSSGRTAFRYWEARSAGPRIYLVDLGELTADAIYTGDERDGARFLHLADAAVALPGAIDWRPDLVHCHDWHAALVPSLQTARGAANAPTVLTLHNIGYQGVFGPALLAAPRFGDVAALLGPALRGGDVNFLRTGIAAATAITTVSPNHADEICTPAYGMGLEDLLAERRSDLTGILNGVDYALWNPAHDPHLPTHYGPTDLAPKYDLKDTLCAQLGLTADRTAPLIAVVSRLAPQKGIDLVAAALATLLAETRASFALLGAGDPVLTATLAAAAAENPQRVAFVNGYDEPLAHRILGGSDLLLMPSRYEPCGLTQMYALKFGTVPVVRRTGGLADTVEHFDPATGRGNGSVFRDADVGGLLWGTLEALGWRNRPAAWSRVIANGMQADFSWQRQVIPYERLYAGLV